jgi:acyl-coenzyme A synthetase/AMP-(fatty) acid ligase
MAVDLPLTRHARLDAMLGITESGPVTVERYLLDVTGLSELLPPHRHIVNLCSDRYRFAVALGAALIREQVSLMPQSDAAGMLSQLAVEFDDVYCLHDGPERAFGIPSVAYPARVGTQHSLTIPCFSENQPAVMLFTSGSTGRPIPHLKSWGCLVRSTLAAGRALAISEIPGATIVGTVPQQHSYGFESTVMLALQNGLTLHHARPFYPADVAAIIEATSRPRVLVTTPFHLRAILADPERLPFVDLVISATASLAPELAAEAENRLGTRLIEIYGCSEAGQLALRRTIDGDEWRCFDGVVLKQDAAGSWASGAPVEGEVLLGDIIELTGPGRFRLHGRTADLVTIAGKRTSLAYLNHQLNSIQGVRDGVFILPEQTANRITRLMAFVVAPGLSSEAIVAALRQRIDPAFLPRPLRLVDALPRNITGKLPRDAIVHFTKSKAK